MVHSKSSSKEVAVVEQTTKAVALTDVPDWGGDVFLGAQDIIIPKLLIMQPTSDMVTEGNAVMGEFRDSVSKEKLGSIADPINFIPFHVEKVWDILEQQDDEQYKWRRSEPLIEDPLKPGYNDNLKWTDIENGINIKRVRRMNFYVMLASQLKEGNAVPYVLAFRSTGYREGKKVFTQMYLRNRRAGLTPAAYSFELSGVRQKNEKGAFIVPSVAMGPATNAAHVGECLEWYKLIKKGAVKVDAAEEETLSAVEVMSEAATMGSEGNF